MQQLEIVYSGIKGAILVSKSSGSPTKEPSFNFKENKRLIRSPSPLKYVRQWYSAAVIIIDMSIKLHPQSVEPWYLL